MDIQLSEKQIEMIASKTARILLRKLKEDNEPPSEYCDVKEAARILGITQNSMRRLKDKFPYIKNGSNQQGRILFVRDALIREYAK